MSWGAGGKGLQCGNLVADGARLGAGCQWALFVLLCMEYLLLFREGIERGWERKRGRKKSKGLCSMVQSY